MQGLNKIKCLFIFFLFSICVPSFGKPLITIAKNTIISKSTTFKNSEINFNTGNLIVVDDAILTIQNSIINGTISPQNPFLITLAKGKLKFINNIVNVSVKDITPDPKKFAKYHLINVSQGEINLVGNHFVVDQSFSLGLLVTQSLPTYHFNIKGNYIENFHGGLILLRSNHATIIDNSFVLVSLSNIFDFESEFNLYKDNHFLFSGNNDVGDAIDLVKSKDISLINNHIDQGSCYSIYILNSQNILVDHNRITGGVTYAIYLAPTSDLNLPLFKDLLDLQHFPILPNNKIIITHNYLAQNRVGLAANGANELTVKNNIFVQKFKNRTIRQSWTNNDMLLKKVNNLVWETNLYKEAFDQENPGDNRYAYQFVIFPERGGVILP